MRAPDRATWRDLASSRPSAGHSGTVTAQMQCQRQEGNRAIPQMPAGHLLWARPLGCWVHKANKPCRASGARAAALTLPLRGHLQTVALRPAQAS